MSTADAEPPLPAFVSVRNGGRQSPSFPPRRLRALEENLAAEMGPSFSLKDFRRELAALRRQGYAVTFGEVDADVIGVAAPLATASGGIVASLGVACFDHPDERALGRMRALLLAAVEMTKGAVVRR